MELLVKFEYTLDLKEYELKKVKYLSEKHNDFERRATKLNSQVGKISKMITDSKCISYREENLSH